MSRPTDNLERFPHIFSPVEQRELKAPYGSMSKYDVYNVHFANLPQLYEFLKSDPEINRKVFRNSLSSITGDYEFAGKPYDEAVEDLISIEAGQYDDFLRIQREFNQVFKGKLKKFATIPSVAGGHLNVPAYSAGAPMCFETEERVVKQKFINLYVALSYNCGTSKSEVFNRALITTSLIKALENRGYSVNLKTYELSYDSDEIIHIVVNVKRHGAKIDMQALYKTLCHVEFLRRILFRVLETSDVTNEWNFGYGRTMDIRMVRDFLEVKGNDIVINEPGDLGIYGNDLAEDFERAIQRLNISDKIDVKDTINRINAKQLTLKNTPR